MLLLTKRIYCFNKWHMLPILDWKPTKFEFSCSSTFQFSYSSVLTQGYFRQCLHNFNTNLSNNDMFNFHFWGKLSLNVYVVTLNCVINGTVWFFGYKYHIISKKSNSSISYMIYPKNQTLPRDLSKKSDTSINYMIMVGFTKLYLI